MTRTYSNGGYSVKVADNGAIRVQSGDWVSRYSLAIHGDFTHVNEFGRRKTGSSTIVPIANVNLIYGGETIYHLPTYKKSQPPKPAAPPLMLPRVVAVATDKTIKPVTTFPDRNNLFGRLPGYGQDITFGTGRAAPKGHDVGSTIAVLKPKMEKLLTEFASKDSSGMAKRLFKQFLAKQSSVKYFDDASLSAAAAAHSHIRFFCDAALSRPNSPGALAGKIRIHQALKAAKWDITNLKPPTDLGVPAFNRGSKYTGSEDWGNGLKVMINGVQHAFVVATKYVYNKTKSKYDITLQYRFYDVFGLDDDDLDEFGAKSDGVFHTTAGVGITAWWQLQHQHGFAPLVTRIVVQKTFTNIPAV